MAVQPIVTAATDRRSYSVLRSDDLPIEPVEPYLQHLDHLNYSPHTSKACARDLDDLFEWIAERGTIRGCT